MSASHLCTKYDIRYDGGEHFAMSDYDEVKAWLLGCGVDIPEAEECAGHWELDPEQLKAIDKDAYKDIVSHWDKGVVSVTADELREFVRDCIEMAPQTGGFAQVFWF